MPLDPIPTPFIRIADQVSCVCKNWDVSQYPWVVLENKRENSYSNISTESFRIPLRMGPHSRANELFTFTYAKEGAYKAVGVGREPRASTYEEEFSIFRTMES